MNTGSTAFASLSSAQQVRRLRETLDPYVGEELALVQHGFNTTFRAGDVAIRINVNSRRSSADVRGEMEFVRFLGQECDGFEVPLPVGLFGGEPVMTVRVEGLDRDLPVIAYRWVAGRHARRHPFIWERIGRALAEIHQVTPQFSFSGGATRPVLRDCIDGADLKPQLAPIYREGMNRANAVIKRLDSATPRILCHFDLHAANVKISADKLNVFDFDDAVFTHPSVDVAQAMYYARHLPKAAENEARFWRGLGGGGPEELGVSSAEFEALVAGRAVLLMNEIVDSVSERLLRIVPKYDDLTQKRLASFLETGVYDPHVAM